MADQRTFIAQVEAAGAEELAKLLAHPTVEQERALRMHLGDERYQRMHGMALKRGMTRALGAASKGNVVVIHGIMGAELKVATGGAGDITWVNAFRIMRGWVERLRLNDEGTAEFDPRYRVEASGIMKRYYGELLLTLSERWNVQAFWFDWRKDLNVAADALLARVNEWFGDDAPVHFVAHSMGGLVARTFAKKHPRRWDAMRRADPTLARGGRLVQLGTPNFGSFAIPQVITGVEGLVKKIALLDLRHSTQELLSTFNSFVGSYQMLPSPHRMPSVEPLYNAGTYGGFNVPQPHLDRARDHHELLNDTSDVERGRFFYVAGFDQPTFVDVRADAWERLDSVKSYVVSPDGDGRVPLRLGLFLKDPGKYDPEEPETLVDTFYIREEHGNLSTNQRILRALDGLLERGEAPDLHKSLREAREEARRSRAVAGAGGQQAAPETEESMRLRWEEKQREDELRMRDSLRRMALSRGISREAFDTVAEDESEQAAVASADGLFADDRPSPEERKVEETITRGFLSFRGEGEAEEDVSFESDPSIERGEIEIGVIYGGIESVDYDALRSAHRRGASGREIGNRPVDAISVGHYIGVQPSAAELGIDRAISAALARQTNVSANEKADLLLTQYTERGIIHGKLGQPFILPDPRPSRADRVIAIAGMGDPGRFGAPELTVMARELCWSLGRLNKRHLATVLIGTGAGNLSVREAVTAWMNGIRRALTGSAYDAGHRLMRITFVEFDPRRVPEIDRHIRAEAERQLRLGLVVDYHGPDAREIERVKREGLERAQQALRDKWESLESVGSDEQPSVAPTRVTLRLDAERKTYHFGAITDVASVPEREVSIDPKVVWQANDELAGEQSPPMQRERGRFLEELLMPDDLRRSLYGLAPLVMLLDATTARIHWEMVAQPDPSAGGGVDGDPQSFDENAFLGTARGFTRQLRTTFAPPPEPPPPPRRVLRVLVVADPAADAHLPGAQEEGVAVADLFESYNTIHRDRVADTRVEVKRLFGPLEATRTNVLRELMVRPYDVLHFAGHCVYRWGGDPTLSGWIFNAAGKEILSASELNRIDRIPKFVFSNACESGITPDRSGERSAPLAPSFAEAFFARGVANFVCTAWPVDDLAARVFALTLYSGLLGIRVDESGRADAQPDDRAKMMAHAMRDARLAIARTSNGRTTWGAYQHYGNPYFQFFYNPEQSRDHPDAADGDGGRGAAKKAGAAKKTGAAKKAGTAKKAGPGGRKGGRARGASKRGAKGAARKKR
jgi:pimeloyl-ACP methyl ester carboxylesterase